MSEMNAQILDLWVIQGKRACEEHRAYVRNLQITKAHEHYYETMGRLAEQFGPGVPELIARPILKLVISEDQQ